MSIRGVDRVILGVEEMDAAQRFLRDFGLTEIEKGQHGATFEALDGTNLVLCGAADRALPMAVGAPTNAREIVWGVDGGEELQKVGAELSKDRQVAMGADGVLRTKDDTGYGIAFQVTKRRAYDAKAALINVAGLPPQRAPNQRVDFAAPHRPRSIGHIVLYVPELERARDFYIERLGFRLTCSARTTSGTSRPRAAAPWSSPATWPTSTTIGKRRSGSTRPTWSPRGAPATRCTDIDVRSPPSCSGRSRAGSRWRSSRHRVLERCMAYIDQPPAAHNVSSER